MNTISDSELIALTLADDKAAFAQLVDRYRDAVCGVTYHYFGNFEDMQDAAQEAFIQAYTNLRQLRDLDKFGPWLRQIAANICLSTLRSRRETAVDPAQVDVRPESGADDEARRSAVRMVVREALQNLSEDVRLTVTLSYINGYSHAEVAQFLDVPVGTVRSRLYSAKKQLRKEMIDMVSDVLHEGKPDEGFTMEVVMKALLRAGAAVQSSKTDEALEHYSEALQLLEKAHSSLTPEQIKTEMIALAQKEIDKTTDDLQRENIRKELEFIKKVHSDDIVKLLESDIVFQKGMAYRRLSKPEDAHACLEQVRETLDNLASDVPIPPMLYEEIAADCTRSGKHDLSVNYYRKALQAYDKTGDFENKALCYWSLGMEHINAQEYDDARQCFDEGSKLLDYHKRSAAAGGYRAAVDLLNDVEESKLPSLLNWSAACLPIHVENGIYQESKLQHRGFDHWASKEPTALQVSAVLCQLACCGKFLDKEMPVGKSWSGESKCFGNRLLKSKVSVLSDSETASVSAGVFERCLLVEYIIEENGQLSKRLAWFAAGIGLVKLQVNTASGLEVIFELTEFSIKQPSSDYLPLEIGNSWTYKWANLPDEYTAVEKWKVIGHKDCDWFLEHYHYAYKRD